VSDTDRLSTVRPVALLLGCMLVASVAVPAGTAVWLRTTNSFFGMMTAAFGRGGQPREIPTEWIFVILGVAAALLYIVPAGVAFLLLRRARTPVRNLVTVAILPLAVGFFCLLLTGRL
jgi:hypothetical protein